MIKYWLFVCFALTSLNIQAQMDDEEIAGVRVKLNDFNRAEPMLFNSEDQEYCKYRNAEGPGTVSIVAFIFQFVFCNPPACPMKYPH